MQDDGCCSDRLVISNDHTFYDMYDVTHLNFVSIFCH